MSNEETLQEYNGRLEENNVSLANVLTTIENLPSSSGGSSSDIYSTEETEIGTWIDGRPLYRRYIHIGNLYSTGTKNVNLTNYGINALEVKFMDVYIINSTTGIGTSINPAYVTMAGDVVCRTILYENADSTTNVLRIATGSNAGDLSENVAYAILTYTKKTNQE